MKPSFLVVYLLAKRGDVGVNINNSSSPFSKGCCSVFWDHENQTWVSSYLPDMNWWDGYLRSKG